MPLTSHIIGNSTVVCGEWDATHKPDIGAYLESGELKYLVEKIGQEVIIVLGGDGVMLEAIDAYRDRGLPFFGINFGTVGYLMHPRDTIQGARSFESTLHPLLKATISAGGKETHHYAFGDLYVKPQEGGKTCEYSTHVHLPQGPELAVQGVISDGIIISTPAGSTGYAANCGADILPIESPQFLVTHIAPPRARNIHPIQISNNSTVVVTPDHLSRRPVYVYTDGRVIHESQVSDNQLTVTIRKATKTVQILIADTHRNAWYIRSYKGDGYSLIS